MVTGTCDQLHAVASWTFLESDCQHTEDARSVLPDLQLGTLFLTFYKTVHFIYIPTFRRQLKHFYFSQY